MSEKRPSTQGRHHERRGPRAGVDLPGPGAVGRAACNAAGELAAHPCRPLPMSFEGGAVEEPLSADALLLRVEPVPSFFWPAIKKSAALNPSPALNSTVAVAREIPTNAETIGGGAAFRAAAHNADQIRTLTPPPPTFGRVGGRRPDLGRSEAQAAAATRRGGGAGAELDAHASLQGAASDSRLPALTELRPTDLTSPAVGYAGRKGKGSMPSPLKPPLLQEGENAVQPLQER